MESNRLMGAVVVLLSVVSFSVQADDHAPIPINITVTNATCSVEPLIEASLDPVDSTVFHGKATITAGEKALYVPLTDCQGTSYVVVTPSGSADKGDSAAFVNQETGDNAAKGIGIYFLRWDKSKFLPTGDVSERKNINDNHVDMGFYAEYVSTSDKIKPGNFSTAITLKLDYN